MKQRNFLRLRHAKAHGDGTLKNPLFFRAPQKHWARILKIVLTVAAFVSGLIGLTYLPAFALQSITIQGTHTIDPAVIESFVRETVQSKHLPLCAKTNVYTVRTTAIENEILSHFSVDAVTVSRQGSSLLVSVKEKVTTIALRTKEKTVMLDLAGTYVRDATAEESRAIDLRIGTAAAQAEETIAPLQADMPIVLDTENDAVTALSEDAARSLLQISDHIGIAGLHPISYTIEGLNAPFVRVDTDASYDVYFDLFARPIEEQIRALQAIVGQNGFTAPKEYIDLRFGAYVYMK